VIVAGPDRLGPVASRIHVAEPQATLLAYGNAVTIWRSTLPDSWYSHDARGNRIFDPTWHTWLMNPASEDWIRFQVTRCRQVLSRYPALNGCFLDQEGSAALVPGYDNMTGTPVDPSTGQTWTPAKWMAATQRIGQRVRSATGKTVVVNGLADGATYDSGSNVLLSGVDGAEAEGWLRGPFDSPTSYPSPPVWKQNVAMIAEAESRGVAVYAVTKVWAHGTPAQIRQWRDFAWCSFLLSQNGRSRFYFTSKYGQDAVQSPPAPPGAPTAALVTQSDGLASRQFTAGTVIVNPTARAATAHISGESYSVPPHTGRIVKLPES
jgi:hypothetical protein